MLIGYTRVSTVVQNLERQDLGEVDRLFEEKASGKDRQRPQLQEMLRFAREGDTVRVYSIDRLARSLPDLMHLVQEMTGNGVSVEFVKENLAFRPGSSNPMDTLLMQILGAFAQFELALMKERQREGIAIAKAKGKYTGRKQALTAEQIEDARARRDLGVPISKIARDLGVARTTLYAALGGLHSYADKAASA